MIYSKSFNLEVEKIAASLGGLSESLSSSPIKNFFKRKGLKKAVESAIKRTDIKLDVLKRDTLSKTNTSKIFTALRNRNKRMNAASKL